MSTAIKSLELFSRAKRHIPGGVNSPVRAFTTVGGIPVFIKSAKGAYLLDVDDKSYIDYINSWGPMILGHANEQIVDAIHTQAKRSTSFGAPTELEIEMAELIKSMVPNIELIRMVNSGTEACMSAIRLARGYTGRNKILKFAGCYHGHADALLVSAGSGVATLAIQSVPGIPASVADDTLVAPFNDLEKASSIVRQFPNEIAAIIIEPVAGNMGCIPPVEGFLDGLRQICDQYGIVLIFDEVMTGFRLAPGGAQERYAIEADLVTYGKVIGGGLPVGAFGGKREIMEHIAPLGNVYQAGTLSGNPIAMTAGYTLLKTLKENPSIYTRVESTTKMLSDTVGDELSKLGLPHTVNRVGSMVSFHFGTHKVSDLDRAKRCQIDLFNRFFHHMLRAGVYLPPSAYESWFVSTAIGPKEIEATRRAVSTFGKF